MVQMIFRTKLVACGDVCWRNLDVGRAQLRAISVFPKGGAAGLLTQLARTPASDLQDGCTVAITSDQISQAVEMSFGGMGKGCRMYSRIQSFFWRFKPIPAK